MALTNYYIGETTNSAGESEINLRLYVSRDIRLRIGSGIWIDRKRLRVDSEEAKTEFRKPQLRPKGRMKV